MLTSTPSLTGQQDASDGCDLAAIRQTSPPPRASKHFHVSDPAGGLRTTATWPGLAWAAHPERETCRLRRPAQFILSRSAGYFVILRRFHARSACLCSPDTRGLHATYSVLCICTFLVFGVRSRGVAVPTSNDVCVFIFILNLFPHTC